MGTAVSKYIFLSNPPGTYDHENAQIRLGTVSKKCLLCERKFGQTLAIQFFKENVD